MPHFVALLRGIGPANPNMRNEKLCAVLGRLGLENVQPVLSSGNLVFTASARSTSALETKIEQALAAELDLTLDVMVRRRDELEALVRQDPFDGAEHGKGLYLTVTFFKDGRAPEFNRLDRATMDGPEFMKGLEQRHGKRITTRTWNTIHKILAKMTGTDDSAPSKKRGR